jgi:hypothetical protein
VTESPELFSFDGKTSNCKAVTITLPFSGIPTSKNATKMTIIKHSIAASTHNNQNLFIIKTIQIAVSDIATTPPPPHPPKNLQE